MTAKTFARDADWGTVVKAYYVLGEFRAAMLSAGSLNALPTVRFWPAITVEFIAAANISSVATFCCRVCAKLCQKYLSGTDWEQPEPDISRALHGGGCSCHYRDTACEPPCRWYCSR